ncbi:MAG: efflux RND transporter periplasmic adaptor subunit [Gemmatimonadales bacterium]|nr:efflux RND transporter periplasmic adaptor subunit [Gemmatimonadales bacterium]
MSGINGWRVVALALVVGACSPEGGAGAGDAAETTMHEDSVVVLTAEAATSAGITSIVVAADDPRDAMDERVLEVPGHVELDPRRVEVLSARVSGRLEDLDVVQGDQVAAGETVGSVFSTAYLTAQTDLQQAARRASLLAPSADSAGARALADAAARRLRLIGESEPAIEALRGGGMPLDLLALRAPRAGSVLESHVLPGRSIALGDPILTIADLTEVDVVAEVPEVSLPSVRVGQSATVAVAAFPGREFRGTVERLHDVLDPQTRTVQAVLHVPNSTRILRPGMYATVRLSVAPDVRRAAGGTRAEDPGVLIPRSALVVDGDETIIFVETAERSYVRRVVRPESLAPAGSMRVDATRVLVRAGVRVGERVVVRGAFTLKSELGKSALEEHE